MLFETCHHVLLGVTAHECRRNGRRWRRRRPWRAHQVGATGTTPTPLEVAVAGGGAALPGCSRSLFMARHMAAGQAPLKKPASMKILSSPSASAWAFTCSEPGTTRACTPAATLRPRAMAAAARRSDAAVGARTDEHLVDGDVGELLTRLQVHVGEGLAGGLLLHRIGDSGAGMVSLTANHLAG